MTPDDTGSRVFSEAVVLDIDLCDWAGTVRVLVFAGHMPPDRDSFPAYIATFSGVREVTVRTGYPGVLDWEWPFDGEKPHPVWNIGDFRALKPRKGARRRLNLLFGPQSPHSPELEIEFDQLTFERIPSDELRVLFPSTASSDGRFVRPGLPELLRKS